MDNGSAGRKWFQAGLGSIAHDCVRSFELQGEELSGRVLKVLGYLDVCFRQLSITLSILFKSLQNGPTHSVHFGHGGPCWRCIGASPEAIRCTKTTDAHASA